jgi:hypothetical protein
LEVDDVDMLNADSETPFANPDILPMGFDRFQSVDVLLLLINKLLSVGYLGLQKGASLLDRIEKLLDFDLLTYLIPNMISYLLLGPIYELYDIAYIDLGGEGCSHGSYQLSTSVLLLFSPHR